MLQIWFRLVVKNVSGQARRIMKSLVSLALVVGVPNLLDQNEDCSFIRIFPLSLNYEVKSCFSSRYSLVTALFQLSTPSQPCFKQASNKHEHLTEREERIQYLVCVQHGITGFSILLQFLLLIFFAEKK